MRPVQNGMVMAVRTVVQSPWPSLLLLWSVSSQFLQFESGNGFRSKEYSIHSRQNQVPARTLLEPRPPQILSRPSCSTHIPLLEESKQAKFSSAPVLLGYTGLSFRWCVLLCFTPGFHDLAAVSCFLMRSVLRHVRNKR